MLFCNPRKSHFNGQTLSPPLARMSSPAPRRSQQAQSQGTSQAARQNIPSSSPLFFRSSPAAAPNGNANMNISSPLKQPSIAGSTPRAPPGGKWILAHLFNLANIGRLVTNSICLFFKPYTCIECCPRTQCTNKQQRTVRAIIKSIRTRVFWCEQL